MRSARVTVGTTATLLVDVDSTHREIHLHALTNTTVMIGGADVTSSNGFVLEKDDGALTIQLPPNEKIFGVVASGTEVVTILLPDA
jgi:hypothetical protein